MRPDGPEWSRDLCDCHFHVFGPEDRYPLVSPRRYVPPVVSIADHRARFGAAGVERRVLVQPSCYGADNRCMLDALAAEGKRARAVVAVAPDITDGELDRMHRAGARGIRVNAVGGSTLSIGQLREIAPRLRRLGWHVQTFLPIGALPERVDDLLAAGVPLVLDHFGSPDVRLGIGQPAMQALARMLDTGRCWVKLAAAFRLSQFGPPFPDLVPYVRELVRLRPDRLVWGSDWPYIHFIDKLPPDFDPLALLAQAIPDASQWAAVVSRNSRELYAFD